MNWQQEGGRGLGKRQQQGELAPTARRGDTHAALHQDREEYQLTGALQRNTPAARQRCGSAMTSVAESLMEPILQGQGLSMAERGPNKGVTCFTQGLRSLVRRRERISDGIQIEPTSLQKSASPGRFLTRHGTPNAKTPPQQLGCQGIPVGLAGI